MHRRADQDGEGVEELHRVDEFARLGEVGYDLDLCRVAEGGVAQGADGGEDHRHDRHHDVEDHVELPRLLH